MPVEFFDKILNIKKTIKSPGIKIQKLLKLDNSYYFARKNSLRSSGLHVCPNFFKVNSYYFVSAQ